MNSYKVKKGIILYDTGYPLFIKGLLENAQKSIYVTMFYINYVSSNKDSVVNELVELLADAAKRGLNVQVYLDKDKEGDVYGSRKINKAAYEFFLKNNVKVCFKEGFGVTHSKVVVIDDEHVIIGSHNWTLSSFYKYNETSIYLQSATVALHYKKEHLSRVFL